MFPDTGLTDSEVEESRARHGTNTIGRGEKSRLLQVLLEIISEPLFFILVGAAIIYFILGESGEGLIMLLAIGFVAGISVFQENRSRNAVDALKKLSAPTARVMRNGIEVVLPTQELVVGDLAALEDGNTTPADGELLRVNDFSVNESILTGESLPVFKYAGDVVFQGSLVTSGACYFRVTAIGSETAMGKIGSSMKAIEPEKTPLQLQIRHFVRQMVGYGAIAFVLVWALNYYTSGDFLHGLLHGLTLAMSVLPEEIPVAFSTFMALGAYHLYKKGVIARSPYTVETLGAATVICVDKTGTLTENRMQLAALYEHGTGTMHDFTTSSFYHVSVLEHALWASETEPFDAMEKVIHAVYSQVAAVDRRREFDLHREYPLEGNPPFMTHVFKNANQEPIIACKGAVEGILKQTAVSQKEKERILDLTNQLASKGYRVLGVATADYPLENLPDSQFGFNFEFSGLIAFYDPPKEGISGALNQFYRAGIQVKMLTGDYPETALAIARQIGLKTGPSVLTGEAVLAMTNSELGQATPNTHVYARMFPEAKLKVIEALKSNGDVVAMTGDGVNDGPALKAAHIGIAMGQRGSEVAKQAASLVLLDDDLARMPEAIALGRRIYENLKKAIRYIISIHIPIILIVTLPLLLFWEFSDIFTPVHVIFLELIMGPTCSIIFENEPIEAGSMARKPRKLSTSFFDHRELGLSVLQGLAITAACLGIGYFYIKQGMPESYIRTAIYTTLIFSNLFLTLVNRSFVFPLPVTLRYRNPLIPLVLAVSLAILFLSMYVAPLRAVFAFAPLDWNALLNCFAAAVLATLWIELKKRF